MKYTISPAHKEYKLGCACKWIQHNSSSNHRWVSWGVAVAPMRPPGTDLADFSKGGDDVSWHSSPQHDQGQREQAGPFATLPAPCHHEFWTRSAKAEELRRGIWEHERTKIKLWRCFTGRVSLGNWHALSESVLFLAKPFQGLLWLFQAGIVGVRTRVVMEKREKFQKMLQSKFHKILVVMVKVRKESRLQIGGGWMDCDSVLN